MQRRCCLNPLTRPQVCAPEVRPAKHTRVPRPIEMSSATPSTVTRWELPALDLLRDAPAAVDRVLEPVEAALLRATEHRAEP